MQQPSDHYTIKEYLLLEDQAEYRNEYRQGHIVAMGGGTINHGIIGNNINTELSLAARSKQPKCIAINGDVRIYIEQANSFVYPDAMVICGDIKSFPSDEHSIVNPLLIVEVLSKSTESYDRGDKFHKYFSLTSLREYVLVDQYKPVVDVFYREDASYWKMTTYIGLKQSVYLTSLDFSIPMADIYRNVQDLEAPPI